MSTTGKILLLLLAMAVVAFIGYRVVFGQTITQKMTWTGTYDPHKDRPASRVASYQMRFSTDSANFFKDTVSASTLVLYPGPVADSGKPDSMDVPGVPSDSRVWFSIRAVDSAGQVDGWSNMAVKQTPDRTPPKPVTNLH